MTGRRQHVGEETRPPRGPSFLGARTWTDLRRLTPGFADAAFVGIPYGVPYDMEGVASAAAAAPEAVRAAAEHFGAELLHYDFDHDGPLFPPEADWRLADCGDVQGDPRDLEGNARAATDAVRAILAAGALPVVLGGDHAIPPLVVAAYEGYAPLWIIDIDAHLDFRDELDGVRSGYSSPIRRLRDLPWVGEVLEIGLRGPGSARPQEVEAALAAGNVLIKADEVHERGVDWIVERIPNGAPCYVTVDVDGLDPSTAPGVQWPLPGGLTFPEAARLLRGVATKGELVGIDVCEFAPSLDVRGLTALTIVRLLTNVLGAAARRSVGREPQW